MLVLLLAQTEAEVCGVAEEADWLCQFVFRTTSNDLLARAAGLGNRVLFAIVIVVVAYVLVRIGNRAVRRFGVRMEQRIQDRLDRAHDRGAITDTQRYRTRRLQRLHAIIGVVQGVLAAIVWVTAVLLIISVFGVRLQPILAGAGLAGIVIGFGAQQLVRDVLAGIAMLIEDQYGVGDWIEVEGKIGAVERVGLRSTAFRDVDGIVHHILNGHIQRVGNLSQHWARATFDVPIALDSDIPATKALIHKVASDLASDPVWGADIIGPPEIWGVQEFGPEGIKIRVTMPTKPLRNWDVTRQLRERLAFAFEQARVRMPSALVDVGGQRVGYAIVTGDLEQPEPDRRVRQRPLVPPDVGPFDRPPADEDAPAADVTRRLDPVRPGEGSGRTRPPADTGRDHTTELRIQRGPEPRPD